MLAKKINFIITVFAIVSLLPACTAITTDSVSGSTESTSESFSDLSSSTSSDDDDEETQAALVLKFVKSNYSRVRSNMAVGKGEHLTTLATLLAIDESKKDQFYTLSKENFNQLFSSPETTAEEMISLLHHKMIKANI